MRHLQITSMHLQDRSIRHLKTSFGIHIQYILQRYLEDVLRRCLSDLRLRHLFDICKMSWQDVLFVLVRHLVDVSLSTGLPMNFGKYLITPFLQNSTGGCFLNMSSFGLSSFRFPLRFPLLT